MIYHTREWFERNRNKIYNSFDVKQCCNCGSEEDLQIHHIVPLSIGGTNRLSNLTLVCGECHRKIHGKSTLNRVLQAEGIALAKQQGKHLGRPVEELTDEQRKTWREVYPRWKDGQVKAVEFMRLLDVKKTKFYRLVKEYEAEKQSTK